jgi:hypothetical protein
MWLIEITIDEQDNATETATKVHNACVDAGVVPTCVEVLDEQGGVLASV